LIGHPRYVFLCFSLYVLFPFWNRVLSGVVQEFEDYFSEIDHIFTGD